jgi:hypothetical protein
MTTDEEALASTMNVLERIVTLALAGFKDEIDPSQALSDIHNLGRNTIRALAERRLCSDSSPEREGK